MEIDSIINIIITGLTNGTTLGWCLHVYFTNKIWKEVK